MAEGVKATGTIDDRSTMYGGTADSLHTNSNMLNSLSVRTNLKRQHVCSWGQRQLYINELTGLTYKSFVDGIISVQEQPRVCCLRKQGEHE